MLMLLLLLLLLLVLRISIKLFSSMTLCCTAVAVWLLLFPVSPFYNLSGAFDDEKEVVVATFNWSLVILLSLVIHVLIHPCVQCWWWISRSCCGNCHCPNLSLCINCCCILGCCCHWVMFGTLQPPVLSTG